jgi:hypothetical protein
MSAGIYTSSSKKLLTGLFPCTIFLVGYLQWIVVLQAIARAVAPFLVK